ncbi:MAG TPA: hypothetical protein VM576_04280 [Xanthomonadaceae bacterium]|jgi:hypothetical protein|nr:hypothetical protein [Xanthomonadaceae bacterium]
MSLHTQLLRGLLVLPMLLLLALAGVTAPDGAVAAPARQAAKAAAATAVANDAAPGAERGVASR